MRNTADVIGGKPIAVLLQSISGVLVAFYDIHGEKREVLIFYFVPDTRRDWTGLDWTLMIKKKLNFTYKTSYGIA
jgi:hypothetical protein